MKHRQVYWGEGIHLTPQLFQQAERAQRDLMLAMHQASRPFGYGFSTLQIEIAGSHIHVVRAAGITSEGTAFDVDGENTPAFDVNPYYKDETTALPLYICFSQTCDVDANSQRIQAVETADTTRPGKSRAIRFLAPNVLLYAPGKHSQAGSEIDNRGFECLQIARVIREQGSVFKLAHDFVPCCVSIAAIPPSLLDATLKTLRSTLRDYAQRAQPQAMAARNDAGTICRLLVIAQTLPILDHQLDPGSNAHPESLYRTLCSLAGGLCALSPALLDPMPSYRHEDLWRTFTELTARVQAQLQVRASYLSIPMARKNAEGHEVLAGELRDQRIQPGVTDVLVGLRPATSPQDLKQKVSGGAITASSLARIAEAIRVAPKGSLVELGSMPMTYAGREGYLYWRVDERVAYGAAIFTEKNIAIWGWDSSDVDVVVVPRSDPR